MLHILLASNGKLGSSFNFYRIFLLSFFGCDDNHTIGTSCTPDTGGGCIFQYRDALHIIRVDAFQRRQIRIGGEFVVYIVVIHDRETVHYHQRSLVGIHRTDTTDGKLPATSSIILTLHTRHQTIQGIGKTGRMTLLQILLADNGIGTRSTLTRDGLITSHHHILQLIAGGHLHMMSGIGRPRGQHIGSRVHTQITVGYLALGGRHLDLIISIRISNRLDIGTLHLDKGTNHSFTLFILHITLEQTVALYFRLLSGDHDDITLTAPLTTPAA